MPDIAAVLKQEISRLSRKEVRASCAPLQQQIRDLRQIVSEQKKTINTLEKQIAKLSSQVPTRVKSLQETADDEKTKVRISPASIKRLRDKFVISQRQLAQLLQVSTNTIVRWEGGSSAPRNRHKQAIAQIRAMGKREMRKLLEQSEE